VIIGLPVRRRNETSPGRPRDAPLPGRPERPKDQPREHHADQSKQNHIDPTKRRGRHHVAVPDGQRRDCGEIHGFPPRRRRPVCRLDGTAEVVHSDRQQNIQHEKASLERTQVPACVVAQFSSPVRVPDASTGVRESTP
jgi:hypothetical protein